MNTTRFHSLLFAALSLGSCSRDATPSAGTDAISVGGATISLPAPDGFFRYDGKSAKVDSFEQQFVSATNRLLAIFGSEETVGEVLMDKIPKSELERTLRRMRNNAVANRLEKIILLRVSNRVKGIKQNNSVLCFSFS